MAVNHVQVDGHSYEDDLEEEEEDFTLFYFEPLLRRDRNERATFLENFCMSVKKWIGRPDDITAQRLLQAHLPTALRLSINSPFEDIRDVMKRLLEELEVRSMYGGLGTRYCIISPKSCLGVMSVCMREGNRISNRFLAVYLD